MKVKKNMLILIGIGVLLFLICAGVFLYFNFFPRTIKVNEEYNKDKDVLFHPINSYSEYKSFILNQYGYEISEDSKLYLTEKDFDKTKYVVVVVSLRGCLESVKDSHYDIKKDSLKAYYDLQEGCEECGPEEYFDLIKIDELKDISKVEVHRRFTSKKVCK